MSIMMSKAIEARWKLVKGTRVCSIGTSYDDTMSRRAIYFKFFLSRFKLSLCVQSSICMLNYVFSRTHHLLSFSKVVDVKRKGSDYDCKYVG